VKSLCGGRFAVVWEGVGCCGQDIVTEERDLLMSLALNMYNVVH
jgi:hypothetical protein